MRRFSVARRASAILPALALGLILPGCGQAPSSPAPATPPAAPLGGQSLEPSPRLILGRVIALDPPRRFAFVELAPDAPRGATVPDTDLIVRTADLRETARLRTTRQLRGRTLGTLVVEGNPGIGDEVVWLAP